VNLLETLAAIGKIVNTHGVKGGLKVQPLSDFPERVKQLRSVFVVKENTTTSYEVEDAFINGRFWVIFLRGIETCEGAGELVGALLSIPLSERYTLPKGAYYLDQIIGLQVYTTGGECLGHIHDVLQTGSNDVYVIRGGEEDKREVLIPALKTVVKKIDLHLGRMDVDPPEGLL
jgi:16S rRNA processing protein RimM